jgi:PHD/YefM family antitoxin component YafN of YafNO toxin-antitoxin module
METSQGRHSRVSKKLANYLLQSDKPVAITRHGDTMGYYFPAPRKPSENESAALKEAAARLQELLAAEGIREDEIIEDFRRWRAGKRK